MERRRLLDEWLEQVYNRIVELDYGASVTSLGPLVSPNGTSSTRQSENLSVPVESRRCWWRFFSSGRRRFGCHHVQDAPRNYDHVLLILPWDCGSDSGSEAQYCVH